MTKRYTACLNPINILGGNRRESGRKRRKERGGEQEREGRRGRRERKEKRGVEKDRMKERRTEGVSSE